MKRSKNRKRKIRRKYWRKRLGEGKIERKRKRKLVRERGEGKIGRERGREGKIEREK